MTVPDPPPADPPAVDPLTRELATQGHRVVFTATGGEPSLVFVQGQLRAYAFTDGAATELRLGDRPERRPFVSDGLDITAGIPVRIILLHTQGEREWFAVIAAPTSPDPATPLPWRVGLIERSGGRGKLLAGHDSYAHTAPSQIHNLYDLQGQLAVIRLGASLYAVAGGRVLVLDGPGPDAARFEERSDPDCPPNKRCYQLPADIDVKRFLGYAPSGRSFVMAGEGDVLRRDTATGATTEFAYHNFFYAGLVEEDTVVLAHAGEPPFVKRWSPATPRPTAPPRPPGSLYVDDPSGAAQLLVEGPIYMQLAKTTVGTLYGVTREGALDRIADGRATPVVTLPAGHRIVAVAAAETLVFVTASDTRPPVHHIVIAAR